METDGAAGCEIARLPEELLSAVVSLAATGPRDACRAATVSPAFRASADSDAVWSRFIPTDLAPLAEPRSKKELFLRLSGSHTLLAGGLTSAWLDRESCAKCCMVAARAMWFAWGEEPRYWNWTPHPDSRFQECAELLNVCWLDIGAMIPRRMLSRNTTYAAYLVFKMAGDSYGLDSPLQEASVGAEGSATSRRVRLQSYHDYENMDTGAEEVPHLPGERSDGWMELEMGEFYNEEADDGDVRVSLTETRGNNWKRGLIVQGIEVRSKT